MLPIFNQLENKNIVKTSVLVAIVLVLPDALGFSLYTSVYLEAILGILFGYGVYISMLVKEKSIFICINNFLICFVLAITKQIGVFFATIILIVLFVRFIIERKSVTDRTKQQIIISLITCIMALAIGYLSWSLSLPTTVATNTPFKPTDISINGFIEIIGGGGLGYQHTTLQNFIDAFFTRPIIRFFNMPFFSIVICFVVLSLVLYIKYSSTEYRYELLALCVIIPIASLLYALSILLIYLFSFVEVEAVGLASYERYMSTFCIGVGTGLLMLMSHVSSKNETSSRNNQLVSNLGLLLIGGIVCAFIAPGSTYEGMIHNAIFEQHDNAIEFKSNHQAFIDKVDLENDKVYLIIQQTNGYEYWTFRYYLHPISSNGNFTWSIGTTTYEGDIWTLSIDANEWSDTLIGEGYKYVYIMNMNDTFINEFGNLFKDPSSISNGKIYSVQRIAGGVQLIEEM
jgi:hypothetical protein